jgi:exosome complex exonuclease RRP6
MADHKAALIAKAGSSSTSRSVPSPTEGFNEYMPVITAALDELTTAANGLPTTKSDINFHRTMDRQFAKDLDNASSRVLQMTERLLSMVDAGQREMKGKGKDKVDFRTAPQAAEKPRRKLEEEEDVIDGYKRGVLGVVDGLLEDSVSTSLFVYGIYD